MNKFNRILLIIALLFVVNQQITLATDNNISIRVGISNNNFQQYLFDNIEFNDANKLNIIDASTGYRAPVNIDSKVLKVTSENNLFRIYIDNILVARNLTGPILISTEQDNFIRIKDLKRKGKQALYRGCFELKRSTKEANKFAIVNILSLKNYLRGVVPNEMPTRFGLEPLKAQTVAARNYAISPRLKAYEEFDLCDSVACQVYFGANTEEDLSDQAIDETNGIVALSNENKPILALYSSTAGGHTESYEFAFSDPQTKAFPSNNIHFLTGVPDKPEFIDLSIEENAEKFYTTCPEAFDDLSPYYRWSRDWTKTELENVLANNLIKQSKTGFVTPQLINENDFGKLISIKPLLRGKSGKIARLQIQTTKNNFIVEKELVIRRTFTKDGKALPSANFVVSYIDAINPVFKFSGGGYGHGVGLSQWGAGKMGSLNYTYDEILQHYYQGIKLATIPVKISPFNNTEDMIFYSTNKNNSVIIKSNAKIKKLIICINGEEIETEIEEETTTVDISKHVEDGINIISYCIEECDDMKTCEVEASVIVKEAINEE